MLKKKEKRNSIPEAVCRNYTVNFCSVTKRNVVMKMCAIIETTWSRSACPESPNEQESFSFPPQ